MLGRFFWNYGIFKIIQFYVKLPNEGMVFNDEWAQKYWIPEPRAYEKSTFENSRYKLHETNLVIH